MATGIIVATGKRHHQRRRNRLDEFKRMSGGFDFIDGGAFQGPDDILIDEYYARQEKKHAGDTINVLNRNWRVAGSSDQANWRASCCRSRWSRT